MRHILPLADPQATQDRAGGKGGSLARLIQAGLPVPDGFVILPTTFENGVLCPEAWTLVQTHLNRLRDAGFPVTFAVRSSAMSEDSAQASFAGEFETVLNIHTDEAIRQAIHTVYHSRHNERVQAYTQAKGLSSGETGHEIAVIVQVLVCAECAGVLFTANPITGQRDQAMISAAWGLGEAIVSGLVTPDTLIVEKATGRVLSRETADKQVMTIRLESGTEEYPVPEAQRRAPVLSDAQAAALTRLGTQIEALFAMPMDIEWTLNYGEFAIVQARPITALPTPEPLPPTTWKLPAGDYIAMRNNIVELMADPLTPLFNTLGRAAINASMGRLLGDFFGRTDMIPSELIISVNDYAYYNGSWSAWQMARILLGSVGIAKRMFTGAVERWTETGRPRYVNIVAHYQAEAWQTWTVSDILQAARVLSEAAIDAYGTLVSGVIPAAWITEGLFTLVYNTLIKRRGDPAAPTYLMGFDSLPIQAEKSLYDLAEWARSQTGLVDYLKQTSTGCIVAQLSSDIVPDVDAGTWHAWKNRFQAHLDQYGHTIYNLDFGNPVPADDPAPLLETLKLFLSGQGTNPHTRQQAAAERREQATQEIQHRLKHLRLKLFRKFLVMAQRYAPLREDGLADVGLSYPLLRQMLRVIGQRFVAAGMIKTADDIFWLKQNEVETAAARIDRGESLKSMSAIMPQRKAAWRAARRATPPVALPQMKVFGIDPMALKSGGMKKHRGDTLKGVAASPGRVTATARLINGPEDFAQMQTGDILVAPLTTPAWTPLFARAAAIVTDIGGPLSHGSIVAREYGIPAVLGTGTATKHIRSGQTITVDGSSGTVTLASSL
ncbi:MAG: phosphoenolpyruvate synthase [Anaerolineae bacterium]|nr:phosphoenolpyruvate synthase [Anaerolineae bacterium]